MEELLLNTRSGLVRLVNTLDKIQVNGKENVATLLACINFGEKLIADIDKEPRKEDEKHNDAV